MPIPAFHQSHPCFGLQRRASQRTLLIMMRRRKGTRFFTHGLSTVLIEKAIYRTEETVLCVYRSKRDTTGFLETLDLPRGLERPLQPLSPCMMR